MKQILLPVVPGGVEVVQEPDDYTRQVEGPFRVFLLLDNEPKVIQSLLYLLGVLLHHHKLAAFLGKTIEAFPDLFLFLEERKEEVESLIQFVVDL